MYYLPYFYECKIVLYIGLQCVCVFFTLLDERKGIGNIRTD